MFVGVIVKFGDIFDGEYGKCLVWLYKDEMYVILNKILLVEIFFVWFFV